MEKQKFLELLTGELKRLEEEEHISDLANNRCCKEVDDIMAEIDYSLLDEYIGSKEEVEKLDIWDIPSKYILTFGIYLSCSIYDESSIMKDWKELQCALKRCGLAGQIIADFMERYTINDCDTFAELMGANDKDDEDTDQ